MVNWTRIQILRPTEETLIKQSKDTRVIQTYRNNTCIWIMLKRGYS